jgi:hypothetical protein
MAGIDIDLEALGGRLTSCDVQIRGLALLARRGDPAALKQIVAARASKTDVAGEMDLMAAARTALNAELDAALEREAQEAREAMSAEALAFAEVVEPIGATLDKVLAAFKEAYADLKGRLHHAEGRGYGPSGAVVQSALTQSLRSTLWRISELAIESPHEGLGRSFSSLTASWAGAARGGAQRLLMAPPAGSPPSPKANGSKPLPASSGPARSIPKQVDLAEALPGDPGEFKVYADRAAADGAIAAAALGPGRKP